MLCFQARSQQKGFSLIALAVILAVAGILLWSLLTPPPAKELQETVRTKNKKLSKIRDALILYYNTNATLPKPASLTMTNATAGYLTSLASCTGIGGSNNGCIAVADNTSISGNILIGAVPTRTLALPDNYAFDEWGDRFGYAIDKSGGTGITLCKSDLSTKILVTDIIGNKEYTASGKVSLVIYSAGKNGKGAYTFKGKQQTTCPSGTSETYNCDNDYKFVMDYKTANYDDLTSYLALPDPATCPANVAGCKMWFDASYSTTVLNASGVQAADTIKVATWKDRSANGNNLTQTTATNQPSLAVAGLLSAKPAIKFFGNLTSGLSMATANTFTFGDFMVFIIYQDDPADALNSSAARLVDHNYLTGFWLGRNGITANSWGGMVPTLADFYDTAGDLYFRDNTAHIMVLGRQGSTFKGYLYDNGTLVNSKTASILATGMEKIYVGRSAGNNAFLSGRISEIAIYPSYSNTTRKKVECYMADKWWGTGACPNMGGMTASSYCTGLGVSYCGGN